MNVTKKILPCFVPKLIMPHIKNCLSFENLSSYSSCKEKSCSCAVNIFCPSLRNLLCVFLCPAIKATAGCRRKQRQLFCVVMPFNRTVVTCEASCALCRHCSVHIHNSHFTVHTLQSHLSLHRTLKMDRFFFTSTN